MEAKKFISTLKGFRTRFTNKPDAEKEKKMVSNLVDKFGKLEAIATLNENGQTELKDYMKGIIGVTSVKSDEAPVEKPVEKKSSKKAAENDEVEEFATAKDGTLYKVDAVKKTVKKVFKDLSSINVDDIELAAMPMTIYQRYLKDNFPGESAPIKKGKLMFRGFRISCDSENGFMVEDSTKRYAVVETPFEGIPTPKELGEWFKKPVVEHSAEELRAAEKLGKELAEAKFKKSEKAEAPVVEEEEVDFEKLRRKVLSTIKKIRSKALDFDPVEFPSMIPFKRWKRKANSLLTQWKKREIRYSKFLNELEAFTEDETFVVEEKRHRSEFVGTYLPEFEKVGNLVGDKLEVDGKLVEAVPFLVEYLLHYEKRAMSQIMKFMAGEIDAVELVNNPLDVDWKVEYNKKSLKNSANNARIIGMVYEAVGIVLPQDMLYEADLKVGDKIMLMIDGELHKRTIASVEKGIVLGKEVGLKKRDNWFKIEK